MTTQNSGQDIFFLSAVRTPFGTYGGSLRDVPVVDFTSHAARAAIERAGIDAMDVDATTFGNVLYTAADSVYFSRHVSLKAGCRDRITGAHGKSLVRLGVPGRRERGRRQSPRRRACVSRRRRRFDVAGAPRRAGHSLGRPARKVRSSRRLPLGSVARHVCRSRDGGDGGESRRALRVCRANVSTNSRCDLSSSRRSVGKLAPSPMRWFRSR